MKKLVLIISAVALLLTGITIFLLIRGGDPADVFVDPPDIPDMDIGDMDGTDRTFDVQGVPDMTHPELTPLSIDEALTGQTARDGYILAPTLVGLTGIDPVSTFVLQTPNEYATDTPSISIDGQSAPDVTRKDDNTFIVTPDIPLGLNNVYLFRLSRDGEADVTWAFQTALNFEITSTFPHNQSTNVPVDTGIEVSFSSPDAPSINDNFIIYPHADGSFTTRGATAIFMPSSPLLYGQIYTVTISAGIYMPNSSNIITTDYVFSFETSPTRDLSISRNRISRVRFSTRHVQFPSFAQPSVRFWVSYDRDEDRPAIEMNVYRIDDNAKAISAIGRLANTPTWSQLSHSENLTDTSGLERISSTRHVDNRVESWHRETFTVPNNLPPGFYVLEAVTDDSIDQVIIQVTDLAVQIIADNDKALVWANDMTTGMPAAGAEVFDPITRRTSTASDSGIAVVDRTLSPDEYIIITADDKQNVVFVRPSDYQTFHHRWTDWGTVDWDWDWDWDWSPMGRSHSANNYYWTVLQLDRTLFQRDDTVSIWGFVQNRRRDENITHVTAVLTEHSWWGSSTRDTLHRQNIPVRDGSYIGEMRLPNLEPGFYEIAIFHGDIAISSTFFNVMDYVTPPYRLTVSASENAVFAGDEVTFTANTAFFEGTPVPDLDISYGFWGHELNFPGRGEQQTDIYGTFELTARPTASGSSVQGERRLTFSAESSLPEVGHVRQETTVRVFVNDINVRATASRTGGDATLSVDVHDIDLSRINDGTSEHWRDFLGTSVAGQRISVEIIETTWESIRDGERYDHITRRVVPRYRFERREATVERFELTTDSDGNASRDFQVPDRDRASYRARLTTTDGNGRRITQYTFIGRDWTGFFSDAEGDLPFLDGANPDGYVIGDEVELTVMRGTDPLTQGNFLFVVVQDGIMSYHVGSNYIRFNFEEKHVPNAQVFAFHFNGHTYHTSGQMTQRLLFNADDRNIYIDISMTQDAYRPGDISTFTIRTTDASGNPKAANVNISLVDEALFALMDYTVDTLDMLYSNVSDRLRFAMATHNTFISDGIDEDEERLSVYEAPAAEADDGGGDGDARIRERFEDTAIFASVNTNDQGEATLTVPLPDNITSWRVTASAISADLYAGNIVQNVRVTLPMFLHYSLGSTFLVGDIPYVGVNAFGTDLLGGEEVTFEVWRDDEPSDVRTATGVAFERVNIPLWEMSEEGTGSLVIQATVGNQNDAIRHTYQVRSSHRLVDTANFYEVTPDTVFELSPGGLTNITFTDRGRGQFLRDLHGLRRTTWRSGARVEGLVARREATQLIQTHFPDVPLFGEPGNFDILEYQTERGGIAILPYAYADIATTVMLIPFIYDDVNLVALRSYLQDIYYGNYNMPIERLIALYGRAMLGEPVLSYLQHYAALTDLPVRDAAYIALGLAALGEMHAARDLYNSHIAPHIQRIEPYYRVNVGNNRADILDATSITAILAARLGMPESMGLYNYSVTHRFDAPNRYEDDALFLVIERLLFIHYDIDNHADAAAEITYTLFGETITRDLGHGGSFNLRIPVQNFHQFNLISTTGEVGAVSVVRTPLEDIEATTNDLVVRREFFRAGTNTRADTFEQDELVRVQITIVYSATDMSGTYIITDFLPAGLVHVSQSARFGDHNRTPGQWTSVTTEGQRITFYDFNSRNERTRTFYYYARVITPGTFMAEGTIVQSRGVRDFMVVDDGAIITLNP